MYIMATVYDIKLKMTVIHVKDSKTGSAISVM